jgi:hypothetical protein
MSAEREQHHQERHERVHEHLEHARHDQLEALRQQHSPEASAEHANERANEARETIKNLEPGDEAAPAEHAEPAAPKGPFGLHLNHKLNYADTMASVQRKLSPASRSFSRIIHTPAVEKASEALERTIARPSVTLGATWTALIVGTLFYLVARTYGYSLSGAEIELSFIVGAVVGLFGEGLWRTLRRSR